MYSPFFLITQEARSKRVALQQALEATAHSISSLSLIVPSNIGSHLKEDISFDDLMDGLSSALCKLNNSLFLHKPPLLQNNNNIQLRSASDASLVVEHILADQYSRYRDLYTDILTVNARPSFLTRTWPNLLLYPLLAYNGFKIVYGSRQDIYAVYDNIKATVKGFLEGWVFDPLMQIIATIRHGATGNNLALMGRASLKSDFASLQRMVIDFGRDYVKLSPEMLQALGDRIQEGDLTLIMKEWEKDIKVNHLLSMVYYVK